MLRRHRSCHRLVSSRMLRRHRSCHRLVSCWRMLRRHRSCHWLVSWWRILRRHRSCPRLVSWWRMLRRHRSSPLLLSWRSLLLLNSSHLLLLPSSMHLRSLPSTWERSLLLHHCTTRQLRHGTSLCNLSIRVSRNFRLSTFRGTGLHATLLQRWAFPGRRRRCIFLPTLWRWHHLSTARTTSHISHLRGRLNHPTPS